MTGDEELIRRAIAESREAMRAGDMPYGAILVIDGREVLSARNSVLTTADVTAHAELNLVRRACAELASEQLARATMYTSTEPCAMCAGAIYWAGIRSLVFSCSTELDAQISEDPFAVPARTVLREGKEETSIRGPLLEGEAAEVLREFWPAYLKASAQRQSAPLVRA